MFTLQVVPFDCVPFLSHPLGQSFPASNYSNRDLPFAALPSSKHGCTSNGHLLSLSNCIPTSTRQDMTYLVVHIIVSYVIVRFLITTTINI